MHTLISLERSSLNSGAAICDPLVWSNLHPADTLSFQLSYIVSIRDSLAYIPHPTNILQRCRVGLAVAGGGTLEAKVATYLHPVGLWRT